MAFRGNAPPVEWCRAHETTGIGGGWLWPRMTVAGDGRRVTLRVATTTATDTEPLAYVGGLGIVAADVFERGVDAFVAAVLRRLAEKSVRETGLHVAYAELKREREDEDAALYRRIEALWGKDVDSASSSLVERFAADGLAIGRHAVEEVVADQSLTTKPSAEQLRKIARRSGHEARSADRISPKFTPRETYGRLAPWIVGVDAAKAVRDKERLGDGPISDARLASMYGVSADCLTHRRRGPFAYALEDGRESVVLRSGSRIGRRFEVARLLADRLLVETDEALRPATRAATFRQKMQRAFAAEFLCPFDALRDVLGGDLLPGDHGKCRKALPRLGFARALATWPIMAWWTCPTKRKSTRHRCTRRLALDWRHSGTEADGSDRRLRARRSRRPHLPHPGARRDPCRDAARVRGSPPGRRRRRGRHRPRRAAQH